MNFSYGMVIQPIDRIGLAVKGSLPPACCVFCRPECIIASQHDPPQNGPMKYFYETGFQIRIEHPRISFGANFQNILTILKFS